MAKQTKLFISGANYCTRLITIQFPNSTLKHPGIDMNYIHTLYELTFYVDVYCILFMIHNCCFISFLHNYYISDCLEYVFIYAFSISDKVE